MDRTDQFGAITRDDVAAALKRAMRPNDILQALIGEEEKRLQAERAMLLAMVEEPR